MPSAFYWPLLVPCAPAGLRRQLTSSLGHMSIGRIRLIFLSIAILCYCLSLILPAIRNGADAWPGFAVLMLGWYGFFVGELRWLANFLFFGAIIKLIAARANKVPLLPFLLSLLGLCVSASCMLMPIRTMQGNGASGYNNSFATLEVGAYVWITSFVILFAASLARSPTSTDKLNG